MEITIHIKGTRALLVGIEHGDAEVVESGKMWSHVIKGYLVLRTQGHKYWSGRGEYSYAPARYRVYRIISRKQDEQLPDRDVVYAEEIAEFPVKTIKEKKND